MNHPWQQPIRPMEILISPDDDPNDLWSLVLFIRPHGDKGWEVITRTGHRWTSDETMLRLARLDD